MDIFLIILALAIIAALTAATLAAGLFARLGFPLPPADRRIGAIDGLRGYLALSVMAHHFFIWLIFSQPGGSWAKPSVNILNQLGAGSVALFFMTTGLVFYPRILKGLEKTDWRSVYITRFFRIVPLVAASVLFIMALIMVRTGHRPDWRSLWSMALWISTWDQPDLLGYPNSAMMNAMVFWSLRYEWLFYLLVLPACAAMMDVARRHSLPSWFVPATLFSIAGIGRVIVWIQGGSAPFFAYVSLFAIGMIAYECQLRPAFRAWFSRPWMAGPVVLSLLLGMTLTDEPYSKSLIFFAFTFIAIACGNDLGGILRTRGALVLGECSFGIYLLHGILLNIAFVDLSDYVMPISMSLKPLILPVLAIIATVTTAITYLLIERPAMRWGKALAAKVTGHGVRLDSRELEVAP